jgi:hypothetical protein
MAWCQEHGCPESVCGEFRHVAPAEPIREALPDGRLRITYPNGVVQCYLPNGVAENVDYDHD